MSYVFVGIHGDNIVITGNTLKCKAVLKGAGGRWNKQLVGWTFAQSEKGNVIEALNGCGMDVTDNTGDGSKRSMDGGNDQEAKRIKPDPGGNGGSSSAGAASPTSANRDGNGDYFFELSAKKRITVRKYREMVLVDIREFYGEPGDLKPGKKGISLTADQWNALKGAINHIDGAIETV
jgi:hypothetical protein